MTILVMPGGMQDSSITQKELSVTLRNLRANLTMTSMRGLALCLALVGAMIIAGCGGSSTSSKVPSSTPVGAAGTSTQSAAVSNTPATAASANSACSSEARAKSHGKSPFAQCVSALNQLK